MVFTITLGQSYGFTPYYGLGVNPFTRYTNSLINYLFHINFCLIFTKLVLYMVMDFLSVMVAMDMEDMVDMEVSEMFLNCYNT